MRSFVIVVLNPAVQVGLQLIKGSVDLLPEGDLVKLLLDRAVEALTDAGGLRAVGLCPRMINVIDGQVQLVVVPLRPAAELGATVSQYAQQVDPFRFQ